MTRAQIFDDLLDFARHDDASRAVNWLKFFVLAVVVLLPALALAGPRSGGSFSGRTGFRSGGGMSSPSRSYSGGGSHYGGGSHFFFLPGWGWGGGMGYGGGIGLLGTLFVLAAVGVGAAMVMRAVRRSRTAGHGGGMAGLWGSPDDDEAAVVQGRAYLYKLQLALGRSARGVQDRLADFAARATPPAKPGWRRCCSRRRSSSCATRTRSATRPPRRADR